MPESKLAQGCLLTVVGGVVLGVLMVLFIPPTDPPPEDHFVAFMRNNVEGTHDVPDGQLLQGGRELCQAMDQMDSQQELLDRLATLHIGLGLSTDDMAMAAVAATGTLCPENAHLTR